MVFLIRDVERKYGGARRTTSEALCKFM